MKRTDLFVMRTIGGADVLVPLGSHVADTNGLLILNRTARYIWDLLAVDHSVDELARALVERFDVEPDFARNDILKFLENIAEMGVIKY